MNRTRSDFFAPARLILLALGFAAVWIVISLFVGTNSAHADEAESRSLLGSVVSGVVSTVEIHTVKTPPADASPAPDSPLTEVVTAKPISRVVSPVAETVDAVIAPAIRASVSPVITAVAPVVTPVVTEVAPIVTPVDSTVDHVVDALPVSDRLPDVSRLLGDTPTADVTGPVTALVDDALVGVTAPATDSDSPTSRLLPFVPEGPAFGSPTAPELDASPSTAVSIDALEGATAEDSAFAAVGAGAESFASSRTKTSATISMWAADLNSGLDVGSASSARPHPDRVPRGPAENGSSALPSTPAASGAASTGGPTGPPSAEAASFFTVALLSGGLLSRAENDALPSSLALKLSSTPD
ncbi:MAG: hypothetical protein ABWX56_05590 [Mycetocola sp.]